MNEHVPRIRRGFPRLAIVILLAALASPAAAQDSTALRPLSLGDAARIAARQNALALEAEARTAQGEARITQRRSALLPSLSASALESGRSFNTATFGIPLPGFAPGGQVISGINTLDVRGRISETLFDLNAIDRLHVARTQVEALRADATNSAEQAAANAAEAYLRVLQADAQLSARLADSVLADSLLGIAQAQVRAGVGVGLDVTRAQAQVASVRAQLIAARNGRDRTRLDLRRALGVSLDARVVLADSLDRMPVSDTVPTEAAALAGALAHRPDLRAADAQLRAAEQALAATRARRLPTVGVFGDEGVIGLNGKSLLNTYDWGVQVSVPLFQGFDRRGLTQEQEAARREIEIRRRDLRQLAAVQVRGALLDLTSAGQEVGAARERLRLATQEVVQARDRFRAGVSGNADAITASLALDESRTQLVDALTAYQAARVALASAEGSVTTLP